LYILLLFSNNKYDAVDVLQEYQERIAMIDTKTAATAILLILPKNDPPQKGKDGYWGTTF
jgi:hypothetical protein